MSGATPPSWPERHSPRVIPPLLIGVDLAEEWGFESLGLLAWLHAHAEADVVWPGTYSVLASIKQLQGALRVGASRWQNLQRAGMGQLLVVLS